MNDLLLTIESFVRFGIKVLHLDPLDAVQARNELYDEFNIYPTNDLAVAKAHDVNYYVDYFKRYFAKQKNDQVTTNIKISKLFNIISPRPSEVTTTFNKLLKKDAKLATRYLYELGINNYYIHQKEISQNVVWDAKFKDGPNLEISINVSKPEKNNKDIAKLVKAVPTTNYPKCVLCLENLGFAGNAKKSPRHNIRIIPMHLNNEDWFMQYSPYGYFNEHMILVDEKHEPMEISPRIFKMLFAFNHMIPHYTITSNSDLPIVGGSILNHEHFQGGNYSFPIQKAKSLFVIKSKRFKHTEISYLDFYNSAIKLAGKDEKEIIEAAAHILNKWRNYSDPSVDIIAKRNGTKQNTITPILQKINNEYRFIMILRNNGVSKKYPDGIFHVHPEYFAIKQEGIGVIEACGRFILPARLIRQIKEVEDVIKHKLNQKVYLKKYPDLISFTHMIETLKKHPKMSPRDYINDVGRNILLNTSVFKKDKNGFKALDKFIKTLNL